MQNHIDEKREADIEEVGIYEGFVNEPFILHHLVTGSH